MTKENKYKALIDTLEKEDIAIFQNCMASLHIQHLRNDIDQYQNTTTDATQKHPTATRQEVAEALGNITEDGIKYHFSRLQKTAS